MLAMPVMPKIAQLPVPNMVKSYLRMADLMSVLMRAQERENDGQDSLPSRGESFARDCDGSTLTSEPLLSDPNVSEMNVSDIE